MLTPYLADVLLAERADQLRAEAAAARAGLLARCCRTSAWAVVGRRLAAAHARAVPARAATTTCCPA